MVYDEGGRARPSYLAEHARELYCAHGFVRKDREAALSFVPGIFGDLAGFCGLVRAIPSELQGVMRIRPSRMPARHHGGMRKITEGAGVRVFTFNASKGF